MSKYRNLVKRITCAGLVVLLLAMEQVPVFASVDSGSETNNTPSRNLTMNAANTGAMSSLTAPEYNEYATSSSNDIIINTTSEIPNTQALAEFLNYKTMTIADMKAFEWSFVLSQFATPLEDNILDVLNHPIFLQMAEQGLTLKRNPQATSEGVAIQDAAFDNKEVTTSDNFKFIAQNIVKNTKYMRLVESLGSDLDTTGDISRSMRDVTLQDLCEAPIGKIYYFLDAEYSSPNLDNTTLLLNRLELLENGLKDQDIGIEYRAIPALVMTNNVRMYLQANLGAFMKMNGELVGSEYSCLSYNDLIGTTGSSGYMGGNNILIDSWGNIVVGHDAKYKIVLANAQNPVFTNSDSVTEAPTASHMNGGTSTPAEPEGFLESIIDNISFTELDLEAATSTTVFTESFDLDSLITPLGVKDSFASISVAPRSMSITPSSTSDWTLILANQDSPLPTNFTPNVTTLTGTYQVDSRIVQSAQQMMQAAKDAGVSLLVTSAYRPFSKQTELFNAKVQEYILAGNTPTEADRIAATIVARPGTSEHQTGLAIDFITATDPSTNLERSFENTEAFRWLSANAATYGFVLRFPENKQEITGIIYEPWHYRYVGTAHAAAMNAAGECLEEYVSGNTGEIQGQSVQSTEEESSDLATSTLEDTPDPPPPTTTAPQQPSSTTEVVSGTTTTYAMGPSTGSNQYLNSATAGDELYTFRYNDRNFAFNKMFVSMYSREMRTSGSASPTDVQNSIVFLNTARNGHYQSYLDVKKSTPNSHRNAAIIFDPMRLAYPKQNIAESLRTYITDGGILSIPYVFLGKDAIDEYSYDFLTEDKLDGTYQGILNNKYVKEDELWELVQAAASMSNMPLQIFKLLTKNTSNWKHHAVELSNTVDPELEGIYYLAYPNYMSIINLIGVGHNNADLPARRYFRLCMLYGINGYKSFPETLDSPFDGATIVTSGTFWENTSAQIQTSLSNIATRDEKLAQVFQTYNYMLGVGLNFHGDLQIPVGIVNVRTNVGRAFWEVGTENDTGLAFVGKDTFDYGQDWPIFSSGEQGMFVRQYRPIHTGSRALYNLDMENEVNTGAVYSPVYFRDDAYFYLLRDTRVSDRWVNYGVEDVALTSFVWLNYYIPKLLPVRTLTYGKSDSETVAAAQAFATNGQSPYPASPVYQAFRQKMEQSLQTSTTTANSAESTFSVVPTSDNDIILGPYPSLLDDTVEPYYLWPDTIPAPLVAENRVIQINPLELTIGLQRNTAWDFNQTEIPAAAVFERQVDTTQVISGVWDFITSPVSVIINIFAGTLQALYNGLASLPIMNAFNLEWIMTNPIYRAAIPLYFLAVGILATFTIIISVMRYFVDKEQRLVSVLWGAVKAYIFAILPLVLFHLFIQAMTATTNAIMTTPTIRAAAVEIEMTTRSRFNNDALFEYYYQPFKQQFDSIIDTDVGMSVQTIDYYISSTGKVVYKNTTINSLSENLRFSGGAHETSVWYDYRGFVPVHQHLYKDTLFYYYYDYIKWQYLQYLATRPSSATTGQYALAQRMMFADPSASYNSADLLNQSGVNAYINFVDTQLLRSQGVMDVMYRDPNYVYGNSIGYHAQKRWPSTYRQDLFGLGYLFQDTADPNEPFDFWKEGTYWEIYKQNTALREVSFTDEFNTRQKFHANNSVYIKDYLRRKDPTRATVREIPFASYTGLYQQIGYISGQGDVQLTPLDAKLMDINEATFDSMKAIIGQYKGELHDEAVIMQAALIATFETNKAFGTLNVTGEKVQPTNIAGQTLALDKILRVLFARNISDISKNAQVIYMVTEMLGGWGIVAAVWVVLGMLLLLVAMFLRFLILGIVLLVGSILGIFYYVIHRQFKRKLLLGVVTQLVGLYIGHVLYLAGLNGLCSLATSSTLNSVLNTTAFMLLNVLLCAWYAALSYILFKNFLSLGGDIIAVAQEVVSSKVQSALEKASNLQGGVKGLMSKGMSLLGPGTPEPAASADNTPATPAEQLLEEQTSEIASNNKKAQEAAKSYDARLATKEESTEHQTQAVNNGRVGIQQGEAYTQHGLILPPDTANALRQASEAASAPKSEIGAPTSGNSDAIVQATSAITGAIKSAAPAAAAAGTVVAPAATAAAVTAAPVVGEAVKTAVPVIGNIAGALKDKARPEFAPVFGTVEKVAQGIAQGIAQPQAGTQTSASITAPTTTVVAPGDTGVPTSSAPSPAIPTAVNASGDNITQSGIIIPPK